MNFGRDKHIESLEQKIIELSEKFNKLSEQQNSQYTDIMMILKEIKNEEDSLTGDELYEEAKEIVVEYQRVSSSFLQRVLRIGYARSARIMDRLEEDGIVGPADSSNPREILIQEEEESQ